MQKYKLAIIIESFSSYYVIITFTIWKFTRYFEGSTNEKKGMTERGSKRGRMNSLGYSTKNLNYS